MKWLLFQGFLTLAAQVKATRLSTMAKPRKRAAKAWPVCLLVLASIVSVADAKDVFGVPLAPEEVRDDTLYLFTFQIGEVRDKRLLDESHVVSSKYLTMPLFPSWSCFPN